MSKNQDNTKDKSQESQESVENQSNQHNQTQDQPEQGDQKSDVVSDNSAGVEDNQTNSTEELTETEKLQKALDAEKDKHLRLFAEFENYKRRTSKERLELFKTAGQEVIQSLLPVLDDFDRAIKELEKTSDKASFSGVGLINNKLRETLKSKGLEPMAVKEGDSFDADLHEAITQIPAPTEGMKGKIIDVVEKGYTLGDKIIRYPKVVTGK